MGKNNVKDLTESLGEKMVKKKKKIEEGSKPFLVY